jgi:hypothetical protein
MIFHGYDASVPPNRPYPGCNAAFGYIGGKTPHVWSLQEWLDATDLGRIRSGPIWTADMSATPESQAEAAAKAATDLGWTAHARVLRFIILDSEESTNVSFIHSFGNELIGKGFLVCDYRTQDAITKAPSGMPEFVAHWNVPPGPFTEYQIAFQYLANLDYENTQIDLDAFDEEMWDRLGRGARHQVR